MELNLCASNATTATTAINAYDGGWLVRFVVGCCYVQIGSKHHKQNTDKKIWQILFDRKVGELVQHKSGRIYYFIFYFILYFVFPMFYHSTNIKL